MISFSAYFVSHHWDGVTDGCDQAAAEADFEYLYDEPYEDRGVVRVAGPFTVESLASHRTLGVYEDDELFDHLETKTVYDRQHDLATTILEHLNTSGAQQAHREHRISFSALTPWAGPAT